MFLSSVELPKKILNLRRGLWGCLVSSSFEIQEAQGLGLAAEVCVCRAAGGLCADSVSGSELNAIVEHSVGVWRIRELAGGVRKYHRPYKQRER